MFSHPQESRTPSSKIKLWTVGLPGAGNGKVRLCGAADGSLSTWAGTAPALHRALNVCAMAGSYLLFGNEGLQIKWCG